MNNKLLKAVLANVMALCMLVVVIPQGDVIIGDDYEVEVLSDCHEDTIQ